MTKLYWWTSPNRRQFEGILRGRSYLFHIEEHFYFKEIDMPVHRLDGGIILANFNKRNDRCQI